MSEESKQEIEIVGPSGRGGARIGAGRPRRDSVQTSKWMRARGINPLLASEILAHVVDEAQTWKRILTSDDDRVVLTAMMFLVSMRDGKPAQQINVTSQSISVSVDDINKARNIVRELMTDQSGEQRANVSSGNGRTDGEAIPLMLSGAEGG